jgi:hypothetical protein
MGGDAPDHPEHTNAEADAKHASQRSSTEEATPRCESNKPPRNTHSHRSDSKAKETGYSTDPSHQRNQECERRRKTSAPDEKQAHPDH